MIRNVLKFLKQKLKVGVVSPSGRNLQPYTTTSTEKRQLSAGHSQSHNQTNISVGH